MTVWPNGSKTKPYVSSGFGARNLANPNASKFHRGMDTVGFSTVRAVEDGVVRVVGTPGGWSGGGTQVWIQHDGFFSRSLHLASYTVRVGQQVKAGDPIGVMGRTGAIDIHLHLEISPGTVHYSNTGQIDPVPFITNRIGSFAGGETTAPPAPVPEEDDMKLITWNGRAWLISDEKVAYVRNDRGSLQMAKMLSKQSEAVAISNDQLTELLFLTAIPWAALDATFRTQAFDNESKWGKGTVWSRQIAEGHEDALRDESLARSIDDLEKSVKEA